MKSDPGWKPHLGGKCPVSLKTFVQVEFRGGGTAIAFANHFIRSDEKWWEHRSPINHENDITFYRLRP